MRQLTIWSLTSRGAQIWVEDKKDKKDKKEKKDKKDKKPKKLLGE